MSSIYGAYTITTEENATLQATTFTYFPLGTSAPPFDWSGWTASMQIRSSADSSNVLKTIVPTLGGALGTVTIPKFTPAELQALRASFGGGSGWYDLVCTDATGNQVIFISPSPFVISRGVTR